jgi:hypothetical protein
MCRPSPFVVPFALGMLAISGICQSRVVPAHAAVADGNERLGVGTNANGFRWQIVVDAGAIAPNGAILSGIAFRSDEREPWPGTAWTNVSISLSYTIAPAAGMSTSFASNVGGAVTTVFQGTVSFPGTSTALAGPSPWDIVVPFAVPYVFTTGQGNLLIDVAKPGPAGGATSIGYYLDCVCGGGSATRFGVPGASASWSGAPNLSCGAASRTLTAGSTITFASTWGVLPAVPPGPGAIAIGLAAQPTPIDLGVLGAPANFVYIDPLVLHSHAWALVPLFSNMVWFGLMSVGVPNDPRLISVVLYAQAVGFDPAANALGIVLGNAVEARIGDPSEQLPLRMLMGSFGAASGSFLPCAGPTAPDYGALALRLDGSFF